MAEVINGILINEAETKNIMTKSSLPDRKSTRLNSSHANESRMPSSA